MADNILLDADSHVSEPLNLWQERLPKKYRDIAPHMETEYKGQPGAWWFIEQDRGPNNVILGFGANKSPYCAVYNLTERRFVAPFENLTLLGLMMCRRGRERNGGIGYGATIQAGLFAIDSQALPPGATSREERDVGRIR